MEDDLVHAAAETDQPRSGQLHAAEEEIERLRLLLDGKFKEALLLRAGPSGDGFQFDIQATVVPLMAEHLAQTLKGLGGENYVTMEFNHEEQGPLLLTIQRRFGEYPAQKVSRLAADNASLRARIAELETALKPWAQAYEVYFDDRDEDHIWVEVKLACGQVRRAHAALASPQREGDRPVSPPYGRQRETINRPVEEEGE